MEDCCLATWLNQLLSQVLSPRRYIDVSSEHTPINYPSKRNSFNIETDDLPTTVAASENSDGFPQRAAASGSSQYVPASEVNSWPGADMWPSTRKLVRGNDSISSVEGTLSRGRRDRDLESAQTLSERRNLHVTGSRKLNWLFKENTQLRKMSEAEADMDKRNWEQRNSYIYLCETNGELKSQRLELYQANQWAAQAQREKIDVCGELEMRN